MSLGNYKIKDTDIASKGVVAAPDKLTGSAEENKKIFDRLIRETVKGDFNGLIDALTAAGVEHMALLAQKCGGVQVHPPQQRQGAGGQHGRHQLAGNRFFRSPDYRPGRTGTPPAEPDEVYQRNGDGPERCDRGHRRKG